MPTEGLDLCRLFRNDSPTGKALSLAAHRPHAPCHWTPVNTQGKHSKAPAWSSWIQLHSRWPARTTCLCPRAAGCGCVCLCMMPCNATSLYTYLHNSENLKDVPVLGGSKKNKQNFVVKKLWMETVIVIIINPNSKLELTCSSQMKLSSHLSIHVTQAAIIHPLVLGTGFSYFQRDGRVILATATEHFVLSQILPVLTGKTDKFDLSALFVNTQHTYLADNDMY